MDAIKTIRNMDAIKTIRNIVGNVINKEYDYELKTSTPVVSENIVKMRKITSNLDLSYKIIERFFNEWEEILTTFDNLYFKMRKDGTIVEYYPKTSNKLYYIDPSLFLFKKMQDVLPKHVGCIVEKEMKKVVNGDQKQVMFNYDLEINGEPLAFQAKIGSFNGSFIVMMVGLVEKKV